MRGRIALILFIALVLSAATASSQVQSEKKSLEDYVRALHDGKNKERGDAAWALVKMGDPRVIGPLVRALADNQSSVRDWAVLALVKFGNRSTNSLIRVLSNDSAINFTVDAGEADLVRWQAAAALGLIKDAKAVEPLISRLNAQNDSTRYWSAISLGMINDSRALGPLTKTLADGNPGVSEGAGWALRRLKGSQATAFLVELLSDDNSSMRTGAARALGDGRDGRAVEPLILALQDESTPVRAEAATSLGKLNDTRAIGPLIEALDENETKLRATAMASLARIGEPAVGPLIQALDGDQAVRRAAAGALGEIGDARAAEPLRRAFMSSDEGTRKDVVKALARLNDTGSVEQMIQILEDHKEDRNLRMDAASALGELRDPRARRPLLDAMTDSDTMIQMRAAEALTKLGRR